MTLGKIPLSDPVLPWKYRALVAVVCLKQCWLPELASLAGLSLHQITVQRIIHFDLQEVKEEISVRSADQTKHVINFIPAYSHRTSLLPLLSLLGQSVIFDTIQNKA